MAEGDDGRYERTIFNLGAVLSGLSDPLVRSRLTESLRAGHLDREYVVALRERLNEVLDEAIKSR